MKKLFVFISIILGSFYSNAQSQAICAGNAATIVPTATVSNPQYTLNPGNNQGTVFVVSPACTTTYTLLAQGSNGSQTTNITVTVNPSPVITPTLTQYSCSTLTNGFNLGLSFNQCPGPTPNYTITWPQLNTPPCITSPQQFTCSPVPPGAHSATIIAQGGCGLIVNFTMTPQLAPAVFSLVPTGPIFSITCNQPTVNIAVNDPNNTYTWTSSSTAPSTDTQVILTNTNVGTWTVVATNTLSGCTSQKTFTLGINVALPQANLTPTFQNITCANPDPVTVTLTAISPTINFTHFVYSPSGGPPFIANTTTVPYQVPAWGTFTYVIRDDNNGCLTTKLFTIATSSGVPTFDVISAPPGFTLGCSTKSVITINFVNVQTDPFPGGAVNYTLLTPSSSTNFVVNGSLSTYTGITTPGSYTAIVKDISSTCINKQIFSIVLSQVGPTIDSILVPNQILNCSIKSTTMAGYAKTFDEIPSTSSLNPISFVWTFTGSPSSFNGYSLQVLTNTNTTPNNTVINTYTLTMMDNNNLCKTTTVIPIYQNLYPPKASITAGGTNSITCTTPTIMLTFGGSTGIPLGGFFPTNSLVIAYRWDGPSPSPITFSSSSYVATIDGFYTVTAMDLNNGCTSQTTIPIFDNKVFPILNNPTVPPPSVLDCGSKSATLIPIVTSATTALSYTWSYAGSPTVSGVFTPSLQTNLAGIYTVTVRNTQNGCTSTTTMSAINGTLVASIAIDKKTGFAPLTVNFVNNSSSTSSQNSITTVWSFGNGKDTTIKLQNFSFSPKITYKQPGTYKVVVFIAKGGCSATFIDTIRVEEPSTLDIPNVFTPNDDGVNDYFFLKATNLTEITFKVFDRWGKQVFEMTSDTGNILWDGKDSSAGAYYYVLTAKGSNDVSYERKGMITVIK